MATHDVNLGIGNYAESGVTGMFYHAAAGTALPSYPGASLAADWKEVGAVSSDGITFNSNWNFEKLKDWAKQTQRTLPSDDSGTVSVPIISTTEESFKTIFGASNVQVSAATGSHGKLISVDVVSNGMPAAEAYLFMIKDDDDMIMIGTTKGYITELAEVAFQPDNAITWNPTISADKWTIMKEAGATGATGATS